MRATRAKRNDFGRGYNKRGPGIHALILSLAVVRQGRKVGQVCVKVNGRTGECVSALVR
jgi:hypothetical protein